MFQLGYCFVYLISMENQIKLANIFETPVQSLYKHLN